MMLFASLWIGITSGSAQRGHIHLITRRPNATQIPTFDTFDNTTLMSDIPDEDFISFTTLFAVITLVIAVFAICLIIATVSKPRSCACASKIKRCCGNDGSNSNTTTTTSSSSSGENNTTATSVEPELSDSDSELSLDSYEEEVFDDFVNSHPKTNNSRLYGNHHLSSLFCKPKGDTHITFDLERNIEFPKDTIYGTGISAGHQNDLSKTVARQQNEIKCLRSELNKRKDGNNSRKLGRKRGRTRVLEGNRNCEIKSDRTMARNERQSRRNSSQNSGDFLIPEPDSPLQFETSVTNFIHMQCIKAQGTETRPAQQYNDSTHKKHSNITGGRNVQGHNEIPQHATATTPQHRRSVPVFAQDFEGMCAPDAMYSRSSLDVNTNESGERATASRNVPHFRWP